MRKRNQRSPEKPDTRRPKLASEAYLERAAAHYLERYSTSTAHFREVLRRKLRRRRLPDGISPKEAEAWVEKLISRYTELGLLDDRGYAEMRATSLFRRGKGARAIAYDLRAKGVGESEIEAALDSLKRESDDPELEAAIAFARRRRLGPFQRPFEREGSDRIKDSRKAHERALGAFARSGFSLSMARAVLDAQTETELEDMLAESREDDP